MDFAPFKIYTPLPQSEAKKRKPDLHGVIIGTLSKEFSNG